MFCKNCGNELKEGAVFCSECGTKLNIEYVPSAENSVYTQWEHQSTSANAGGVNFEDAIKLFFKNYANFSGRATKSEYWWAFLFNFLASFILGLIPYVGAVLSLVLMIPALSVGIRRLHDTGKTWTYILINLIPIAGTIMYIIQLCKDSDGDNQWGPCAK